MADRIHREAEGSTGRRRGDSGRGGGPPRRPADSRGLHAARTHGFP